ncbi:MULTISPECIES: HAD family phosphatase [Labilibaculum]|uniref:Beta-phosphoglucomutase family hydrolase n=1 Tax=Labilibaculum euxinus TaxID=2686357 RepID=A0A7M4D9Z9_9BACT|nr:MULTISPECIES: beta-phosphoglucomutase family hydrolase [Labilibaculum]MBN2598420.1 beta-phosphoglucomutase family hydrolase [Marinifilaceae bacterium]MUP39478.1 beta-phosphoglucomutase family hydrolase [Labilibaculum euxinus]MVB08683.1 beta-phosphoglucomutase family hydrolase [Labilibaculum euxinus]
MKKIDIFPSTKAFIFDLDGTLADTMPLHYEAWVKTAKIMNLEFSIDFLKSCAGMPSSKIIDLLNEKNNRTIDPQKFSDMKEEFFAKEMHKIKEITAVTDLVYKYHGKIPMAVGTGGKRNIASETMQLLGLDKYISILVSADDVENHKPEPDTFLKCAELMGISPENCQVFEDASLGFRAAEAAGMRVTDVTPFY